MSQTGNRKLRMLLLSVLCLVAWHGAVSMPALAQRRVPSNAPPETPSQRWLPLPQGGSTDLKQQVQWLQQLKGLVGTDALGGETPSLPQFDPEQLKTLLDAVKQMSGGLPDGTQPPALDGVTPEQVSKALADPALREQARRLLEQFSRDGKLPQRGAATDTQGVPFPVNSPKRGTQANGETLERNRSASATGEESSAMPRAMQELLQRLAQQAGREPNGPPLERDPATSGSSEQDLRTSDARNELNRPSRPPAADQRPAVNQPRGVTQPPGATERPGVLAPDGSERVPGADARPGTLRRNDSTSAPALSPSVAEMLRNGPLTRDQTGARGQAGSNEPRSSGPGSLAPESRDASSSIPRPNSGPSMADRSNRGMPGGSPVAGSRNSVPARPSRPTVSRDRESRSDAMPSEPTPDRGPTPINPPSDAKPPSIDVRSELEQQGFAQTLRKIVEQAREEGLASSNGGVSSSTGGGPVGSGSPTGLEGSVMRMFDGLRKSLIESAPESPVPSPVPVASQPGAALSSVPQPNPEGRSPLSRVSRAAGSILSDIATPPASRPVTARSPRATSSGGATDAPGAGSRSAVGLLMLLAVLGAVWYFVPHLVAAINGSQRAVSGIVGEIHPADIRSRSDVVRAFHQYALRPATPAPTWWTHREVERQVAQTTPTLRPAIRTLTDLYEQARYLPDDADLTPDQIGTARRALEQCAAASS